MIDYKNCDECGLISKEGNQNIFGVSRPFLFHDWRVLLNIYEFLLVMKVNQLYPVIKLTFSYYRIFILKT
jgi:hypothetical protein